MRLRLSSLERVDSEWFTIAVRAPFMITRTNQSPARSPHRAFNNAAASHPSQWWPTVVPDWWKRQRGLPTLRLRLSSPKRVGSECTASAVRSPFMITRPNQSPSRSPHRACSNAAASHPSQWWPIVDSDWLKRQRGLPTLRLRLSSLERVGSECITSAVLSSYMITRFNQSPARSPHRAVNNAAASHPSQWWPTVDFVWWKRQRA